MIQVEKKKNVCFNVVMQKVYVKITDTHHSISFQGERWRHCSQFEKKHDPNKKKKININQTFLR